MDKESSFKKLTKAAPVIKEGSVSGSEDDMSAPGQFKLTPLPVENLKSITENLIDIEKELLQA